MNILLNILIEFWNVITAMSPYLLFGFFVAGILSVLISQEMVEKHIGEETILSVIKATFFGVPLPLCSCGVIPVAASLRRDGASKGATTAFLLSTPQTGVDSILVTLSLLGPVFAIFRPLTALFTGFLGGLAVKFFEPKKKENVSVSEIYENNHGSIDTKGNKVKQIFHYGFVTLAGDIGKPLIIGLFIAGVISATIPNDYFLGIFGSGIGAMVIMMLVGIPVYVCATASVPIAAALILKGISPGAALVFLMTGPATNAATITTIWKIMGKRTLIIYLLTIIFTAFLSGTILDYFFKISHLSPKAKIGWMLPDIIKSISAVILLAILASVLFKPSKKLLFSSQADKKEDIIELLIKGMRCNHCVISVKKAITEHQGVDSVEVDLKTGRVIIKGKKVDTPSICRAVDELGYSCISKQYS